MTAQDLVRKIDNEYISQFPKDHQGPVALGIGAYQAGDLELTKLNELLDELERLAEDAGYKIENGYFEIVREHAEKLAGLIQKEICQESGVMPVLGARTRGGRPI